MFQDTPTVDCPECRSAIYEEADRCPYCGFYLLLDTEEEEEESEDCIDCPNCRRAIDDDSEQCPHCGLYITEEDEAISEDKPYWLIIGVILCLAVVIFGWILSMG